MKWFPCNHKSYEPPLNVDLLLAHKAAHFPDVALARWSGTVWYNPNDDEYFYRETEVDYWSKWPEYPKLKDLA